MRSPQSYRHKFFSSTTSGRCRHKKQSQTYVEAIPIPYQTAQCIVPELVKLFSKMGIPKMPTQIKDIILKMYCLVRLWNNSDNLIIVIPIRLIMILIRRILYHWSYRDYGKSPHTAVFHYDLESMLGENLQSVVAVLLPIVWTIIICNCKLFMA